MVTRKRTCITNHDIYFAVLSILLANEKATSLVRPLPSLSSPLLSSCCQPKIKEESLLSFALYRSSALFVVPQQLGSFENLQLEDKRPVQVRFLGIWGDEPPILFQDAWTIQKVLQQNHFQNTTSCSKNEYRVSSNKIHQSPLDSLLVLQHEPVYTFGTASDPAFLLNKDCGIPTVDISRGGEVTYHGPGQLVVYPVINLQHYRPDLHWYMRALEEAVMLAISNLLAANRARDHWAEDGSLHPTRCDETTGVWLDNVKVAAIGVHARRWITQHGVAINVEDSCLGGFSHIVPCGLVGRKVGCLNQFLDTPITVADFVPYVLSAMEQIFCMELQYVDSTR